MVNSSERRHFAKNLSPAGHWDQMVLELRCNKPLKLRSFKKLGHEHWPSTWHIIKTK